VTALTQERYENLMIPALEKEYGCYAIQWFAPSSRHARDALPVLPAEKGDPAFIRNGWTLAESDRPPKSPGALLGARPPGTRRFESLPVRKSALPSWKYPWRGIWVSRAFAGTGGNRHRQNHPVSPPTPQSAMAQRLRAGAGRRIQIVARDDSETKWFAFKAPRKWAALLLGDAFTGRMEVFSRGRRWLRPLQFSQAAHSPAKLR